MATLKDIKPSILELNPKDQFALVESIRLTRGNYHKKVIDAKAKKVLKKLTPDQKRELLKILGDQLNE